MQEALHMFDMRPYVVLVAKVLEKVGKTLEGHTCAQIMPELSTANGTKN
jgi:hypothetical protein